MGNQLHAKNYDRCDDLSDYWSLYQDIMKRSLVLECTCPDLWVFALHIGTARGEEMVGEKNGLG